LGSSDFTFRHHLETEIIDDTNAKISKRFFRVQSLGALFALNPNKIKIDCIGDLKV
jgi:hypothetical protein